MHYLCSSGAELEVGGYIVVWDTLKQRCLEKTARRCPKNKSTRMGVTNYVYTK